MSRSDDLTAESAFEMVLDRLVSEQKDRYADLNARVEAESKLRETVQQLQAERTTSAQLRDALQRFNNADDVFVTLYDVVERLGKVLGDEEAKELRAAVAGAKKFIDPIPF